MGRLLLVLNTAPLHGIHPGHFRLVLLVARLGIIGDLGVFLIHLAVGLFLFNRLHALLEPLLQSRHGVLAVLLQHGHGVKSPGIAGRLLLVADLGQWRVVVQPAPLGHHGFLFWRDALHIPGPGCGELAHALHRVECLAALAGLVHLLRQSRLRCLALLLCGLRVNLALLAVALQRPGVCALVVLQLVLAALEVLQRLGPGIGRALQKRLEKAHATPPAMRLTTLPC